MTLRGAKAVLAAAFTAAVGLGLVAAWPSRGIDAGPPPSAAPPVVSPAPPVVPPMATPPAAPSPSRAIGKPYAGRLVRGVQLPAEGTHHFTWDPVLRTSPNRGWRRFGTDRLVRTTLAVLEEFAGRYPEVPRIGIGDLSRRHGGDFGQRFGGRGHASHQNGLDVDVYYPRLDRLERRALRPAQVDRRLSQALIDLFVRAGAQYVFIGPRVRLAGKRRVVQRIPYHDDHMHVRLPGG